MITQGCGSMDNIKQLRIRIINGVNFEDGFIYSDGFDLMNIVELQYLKNICQSYIIEGFSVETSIFDKGEHKRQHIKNEFHPFLEYIHADKMKNGFLFQGELFSEMSYHIVRASILDVNQDISRLLNSIVLGDIEKTLEEIVQTLDLLEYGKNPKIACLA